MHVGTCTHMLAYANMHVDTCMHMHIHADANDSAHAHTHPHRCANSNSNNENNNNECNMIIDSEIAIELVISTTTTSKMD